MGLFDRFKKYRSDSLKKTDSDKTTVYNPETTERNTVAQDKSISLDDDSISLSVSKDTDFESIEKPFSNFHNESITNEEISKGDYLLDTYNVISDAIKGGMGNVWKVRHITWDTDLAMKRPQPKFFAEGSEKRKENFVHECESWINLGLHPNIVSCYYIREIGGVPTIFSEWMDNGSLKNRIDDGSLYVLSDTENISDDKKERMLQARLIDIAVQFARGLHYAHESKDHLIHQDVKPDNLLLSNNWDAKIADFGLAKARKHLNDDTLNSDSDLIEDSYLSDEKTHMASTGGYTPAYCSSEQYSGDVLTRRTDIYSWAVSILEMYCGKRLWKNGVEAGEECITYFNESRVKIPDDLRDLLTQCLKRDPSDRPHDFSVIIDKLTEIYKKVVKTEYPREDTKAAADSADSLNNRAVSMVDLGRMNEASDLFEMAYDKDPSNTLLNINRSFFRWNKGIINDKALIDIVENSGIGESDKGKFLSAVSKSHGELETVFDFSKFGSYFLVMSNNGNCGVFQNRDTEKLVLFDLDLNEIKGPYDMNEPPFNCLGDIGFVHIHACSNDGRYLYFYNILNNEVLIFDNKKGCISSRSIVCQDKSLSLRHLSVSSDRSLLTVVYGNSDTSNFATFNGQNLKQLSPPIKSSKCCCICSVSKDKGFVTAVYDKNENVYHVKRVSDNMKKTYWDYPVQSDVTEISVSADDKTVCFAGQTGILYILDINTGKLLKKIEMTSKYIDHVGFLDKGKYLACSSQDNLYIIDYPELKNVHTLTNLEHDGSKTDIRIISDYIFYKRNKRSWIIAGYRPGDEVSSKYYLVAKAKSTLKAFDDETRYKENLKLSNQLYEAGDISGALTAVDDAFSSSAMDSREAEDVNDKIGINAEINFLRYIYLLYNYGADKDIPCIFKNNVVEDTGYSLDDLKVCCSNGDVLVSLEQACRLITREDNGKTYIDRPGPITAYAMTKEIHDETLFSKEDFNGVSTYKVDGNGAGYYIDSAISALPKAVSPSGFATSFYNSVSLAANSKGDLVVWRQLPNLKSEIRKISGIHNDIVTKVVSHIDSSDKHTVFFLPGEKDFIAYNYKKTLCYNFESGELLSEYPGTFPAISRNGKTIAVLDRALGNKISFYNTFSGQHLKDLDFSESVRKMIFINDCSLMLVLCKDGTLYVYDYQNEIFDKILLGTDNGNVYDMVLSDDRRYLIVHNMIHEIRVYRMVWHYQQKNDM